MVLILDSDGSFSFYRAELILDRAVNESQELYKPGPLLSNDFTLWVTLIYKNMISLNTPTKGNNDNRFPFWMKFNNTRCHNSLLQPKPGIQEIYDMLRLFQSHILVTDMQKDKFFTQTWFQPKIFYPKKCVNYNEWNLRQNSVKGPKDPNSAKNYKK